MLIRLLSVVTSWIINHPDYIVKLGVNNQNSVESYTYAYSDKGCNNYENDESSYG